jgi:uncharacterized repeat protein (TIGR01451 family)
MTRHASTWSFRLLFVVLLTFAISPSAFGQIGASSVPDCNDPDAHDINCTEPTKAIILDARQAGYPYYIGHAEPTTLFFSTAGASGHNMQWKFKLPATDPAPTQNGSSVASFELYSTFWLGLALCDPNSNPFGPCIATSDLNNPGTAGAAFLELQFYPPGPNCSDTQWCVRLHINTLQNINAFQRTNCLEPTTEAFVTTDGTPGGPLLLMSNGDTIVVTIHDTANGLETDVNDQTSSTSGSMVASGANGFVHNADQSTCATTAFDFHAMYATASPGQVVPWASLGPNVSFDFEIGHFELCGDPGCTTLPDNSDTDDTNCQTVRGIGGCFGSDLDHDGTPYQADWPDGSAAHPASVILGAPNDRGVGPLNAATSGSSTYDEGYDTITFQTTEATTGAFYPFWSQAGTGSSCRFNFGNDIAGTTTNDFGKATQYGTTISNPCFPAPDLTVKKSHFDPFTQGDSDTFTITVSNVGGAATSGTATVADSLPPSFTPTAMSGGGWTCTVATATCTTANVLAAGASYPAITLTVDVAANAPPFPTNTVTVSGGNEASNVSGNDIAKDPVTVRQRTTTIMQAATQDFDNTIALRATVAPAGVAGSVQFFVNGSSVGIATYDSGSGVATLPYLVTPAAGSYSLVADFTSANPLFLNSIGILPTGLTVTLEETTLSYSGDTVIANGGTAIMSGILLEEGIRPVAGRTVQFTLGTGSSAQLCNGVTNASGIATCAIGPVAQPLGPGVMADAFVGDAFYKPASAGATTVMFAFLTNGADVLGDLSASIGAGVTFWGAHWSSSNSLSGGAAPASFKGFASTLTGEPPTCGSTWTTGPGNSSDPPATLPAYMGVLVSSAVGKSGPTIAGDILRIVVVQTNGGYAPNPGHAGTGTVVAQFCHP